MFFPFILSFFALTGAQGVTLSVCPATSLFRVVKSAIPYMQRLLNEDIKRQLKDLKQLKPKTLSVTNKLCLCLGFIVVIINLYYYLLLEQSIFFFLGKREIGEQLENSESDQRTLREQSERKDSFKMRVIQSEP